MRLKILRNDGTTSYEQTFELSKDHATVLGALREVQQEQDATLAYREGCRSGICGCCAVKKDGKPVLACIAEMSEECLVEPLSYLDVQRDLIVDQEKTEQLLKESQAWLEDSHEVKVQPDDEKRYRIQSDCILCQSCYSVCPVLEVRPDFLGPYALSRVFRYVVDNREDEVKSKIDSIQKEGVWDCTLCGECTLACPQGIDPKNDILMLRGRSATFGYTDPTLQTGAAGFGFDPVPGGFYPTGGFNPSG